MPFPLTAKLTIKVDRLHLSSEEIKKLEKGMAEAADANQGVVGESLGPFGKDRNGARFDQSGVTRHMRGEEMMRRILFKSVLTVGLMAAALFVSIGQAKENVFEAVPLGVEAYIYGYPLVTMEMTRRVMTNVEKPEGTRAPMGQFVRMREYPSAAFRDVTAPNADTLYTTAWLDVGEEPWVLSLPDAQDRFYLFPMLDGWTEVFEVPGKRTTGTGPQTYAITGPGWKGTLPAGVTEYKSPTSLVWLLGRIYCTGTPEDYAAVHKLQDEISLVPLSAYGKPYTPPLGKVDPTVDMKTAVREQVNALSADEYFGLLAKLLVNNPPAATDKHILEKMAKIGIVPVLPRTQDRQ